MNLFDNYKPATRAFLLCLVLVAVCYANSILNAFILDDILIVGANERIRHIEPLQFLFQSYWGDINHAGIYRPLTIFSFSLEYPVWGVWAPGYRITNLLLHTVNGWLVFLIAQGLSGSPAAALAAAVVYVIHPVQTEAVVSIVGRSELLAACFFFCAWLAFRKGRTWLSAPAYFMAMLAKESAITLPAILILDMALHERSECEPDRAKQGHERSECEPDRAKQGHERSGCEPDRAKQGIVINGIRNVLKSWRRLSVLAVTGLGYLALRFYVLGGLGIPTSGQYLSGSVTLFQRWITSGRVFIQYVKLLLAPVDIASDYDFNSIPLARISDWDAWLGLAAIAGVLFLAFRAAKVRSRYALGIFFFFIALLPVSNWILPIALLMAERFLYTPIFGFALLAGLVWAGIPEASLRRVIGVGFVAIASVLCIAHNYVWQDTLTFHRNAVRVAPNNARARLGYGFALLRVDKVPEAAEQFEAGLRILPDSAPLLAGLASATMKLDGNCDRVRPLLAQALAKEPGQWHSLWILGDCFMHEGNTEQAEKSYRLAIKNTDFPDAQLLFSWASILEAKGEKPAALAAYQRAALIDPADYAVTLKLRQLAR